MHLEKKNWKDLQEEYNMSFKSGFVSIIGKPNAGKSTLLNRLTGEKIAIISNKPQTTRNTIRTIITDDESQIIFIDTPGIHRPKTKLGEYMVNEINESIGSVDIIVYLVDVKRTYIKGEERNLLEKLKATNKKVILGLNKIDLIDKQELLPIIAKYKDEMDFSGIYPISAKDGYGVSDILAKIKNLLPEGPLYYPEDSLTDQPEREIVAEIVREKMLRLLDDEVPHGIGVEIMKFKDRENKDLIDIEATIYCEKNSHKGIIIGKKGSMLKKIGMYAREDIEKMLNTKVNLQLWVKIKDDWRNSKSMLSTLGYK